MVPFENTIHLCRESKNTFQFHEKKLSIPHIPRKSRTVEDICINLSRFVVVKRKKSAKLTSQEAIHKFSKILYSFGWSVVQCFKGNEALSPFSHIACVSACFREGKGKNETLDKEKMIEKIVGKTPKQGLFIPRFVKILCKKNKLLWSHCGKSGLFWGIPEMSKISYEF